MAVPTLIARDKILVEGFQIPPDLYYSALAAALDSYHVEGVRIGSVFHKEGGFFSASREHLRVLHNEYFFDILCAPFGSGSFVSWWSYHFPVAETAWSGIPFIDRVIASTFHPPTPYGADTSALFCEWVKRTVRETIENLTTEQVDRQFVDPSSKPILRDFFER
jgi:hypothetical protein